MSRETSKPVGIFAHPVLPSQSQWDFINEFLVEMPELRFDI